MRRNKYGYAGTDSAGNGIWNWLLNLTERKFGYVPHQKWLTDFLFDAIKEGFAATSPAPVRDVDNFIQSRWSDFTKYAKDRFELFYSEAEQSRDHLYS